MRNFATGIATHLFLPGTSGNFASIPDNAALDIVGDLDVRAKVALDDWTPSGSQALLVKRNSNTTIAYDFHVRANGSLRLAWSTDGSTEITATSSDSVIATAPIWTRATLDISNGSSVWEVLFYTSTDYDPDDVASGTWDQLGVARNGVVATSIANTASVLGIGARNNGTADNTAGRFYRAQIFASLDNTAKKLDVDFTKGPIDQTSFAESASGLIVTINQGSASSKAAIVDEAA